MSDKYCERTEHVQQRWEEFVQNSEKDVDEVKKLLPLAKIRKIIKHDPDIRMLNEETPYVVIKLCELFIADMTNRAWHERDDPSTKATLQEEDFQRIIDSVPLYDFLRHPENDDGDPT